MVTVFSCQGIGSISHSHQEVLEGPQGRRPTRGAYIPESDVEPGAAEVRFDLPNPEAARKAQHKSTTSDQKFYNRKDNSCITYCGRILREGGVDLPEDDEEMTRHLKLVVNVELWSKESE